MHWAARYVGMPYEPGARGPEKVDCWGLVRMAYLDYFNIELPLYPGLSMEANPIEAATLINNGLAKGGDWIQVNNPIDGCLVAMSHGTVIHHVGFYADVDIGRILHCNNGQMVVADTPRGLRMRGIRIIQYYIHRLWPTSLRPRTPSSP